jgi:hypothetical protein
MWISKCIVFGEHPGPRAVGAGEKEENTRCCQRAPGKEYEGHHWEGFKQVSDVISLTCQTAPLGCCAQR